ncbi:MAG: TonB-dependent receptor [Ignavibacteriales bacterium]|nr:MAG: TonB-dependent receptor [Ignavibacteriaceae bacterium]MBW7873489.1 TonB-dependent receptor [Ignavibacteria bacterium]MCZ2142180.1 TonB-dependent receptor [Ignavibacteriales bacterium]OQY70214.1 MAG: hypothetical protein B6D45_11550 [Ignavibacteriales bacterium UTCHB3]MBV6444915.1 hypothetical protein [Ignavibacteriaceae bacterium]
MKHLTIFTILALLLCNDGAFPQWQNSGNYQGGGTPSGEISGVLLDAKTGQPVEYGNFVLYQQKNKELVNGTVSGTGGTFKLSKVPYGFYRAEISFIGYETFVIDSIMITPKNSAVNLGTLKLRPAGYTTEEVTVTGEKEAIINNLDKQVINVDKDIASAGGNAADVLRNVPSVQVDIEGNITLRGNGNIKILIDGRPANTGGQSLADILASIPAGSIETIELVTNPSAKYDAEGTAGIINIKLKKKSNLGLNGMLSSNVGTKDKYNSSVNLNYKLEDINFFGNFDFRINNFFGEGNSERNAFYPGVTNRLSATSNGNFRMNMFNYNLGFDWFLDDFNTITLQGNYRKFDFNNANKAFNSSVITGQPDQNYLRVSEGGRDFANQNYSLNYKRSFTDKNKELSADFTWSRNNATLDGFSIVDAYNNLPLQKTKNVSDNQFTFFVGSVDWSMPLFDNSAKMETGLKTTFRQMRTGISYFNNDPVTDAWVWNSAASNRFNYDEQIHAAFLIFTGSLGDFKYQAGLRAETTIADGKTDKADVKVDKNYTDFFPSVYFSWAPTMTQEVRANYSRRVDRPYPRQVNPFVDNTDSLNLFRGNPDLNPQFTDSYELGYSLFLGKLNFVTTLFYRQTNDAMSMFTRLLPGGVTERTFANIATQKNTGFEISTGGEILPGFRLMPSFSWFRTQLDGQSGLTTIHQDDYSWNAKIISSLNVIEGGTLQVFFNYNAPSVMAQGKTEEVYFMDIAYKQDFFNGNLSLTVRVSDLFNTMKWNSSTFGPNFDSFNFYKNDSRNVFVGLTYIFNSFQKKPQKPIDDGGMGQGQDQF